MREGGGHAAMSLAISCSLEKEKKEQKIVFFKCIFFNVSQIIQKTCVVVVSIRTL